MWSESKYVIYLLEQGVQGSGAVTIPGSIEEMTQHGT